MHICVSKRNIIGSAIGLSPKLWRAIIWTIAGILLIGPLGINFSGILIEIHTYSFKKLHLKMPSGKGQTFFFFFFFLGGGGGGGGGRFKNTYCPACRTTLVATRFRVAVICPIIQVPHCIRVFLYFVWFVFFNHIFHLITFYYELCTYCNILDIYLS